MYESHTQKKLYIICKQKREKGVTFRTSPVRDVKEEIVRRTFFYATADD